MPSDETIPPATGSELPAPTQTPVNYEDTVKGPAGDTDPATQQWRAENWERGVKRAEEMAHAEDPYQNTAMLSRQTADRYEQEGNPDRAAERRENARMFEERAAKEGERAGGRYDAEHPAGPVDLAAMKHEMDSHDAQDERMRGGGIFEESDNV